MTVWEYRARIFYIDKDHNLVKDYFLRNYPAREWQDIPQHHPITLEAHLNKWGEDGWELVTMELGDRIGKKGDLGVAYNNLPEYRKAFYCVFKRPRDRF